MRKFLVAVEETQNHDQEYSESFLDVSTNLDDIQEKKVLEYMIENPQEFFGTHGSYFVTEEQIDSILTELDVIDLQNDLQKKERKKERKLKK